MSDRFFLTLREHTGPESEFLHVLDPKTGEYKPNPKAGEPAPLTSVGCVIPYPVMVGDEVAEDIRTAHIVPLPEIDEDWAARPVKDDVPVIACARIIPGTRIVETNAPPVRDKLLADGWQVCDPPKQDTKARQAAGRASDEKAGE